MISRSHSQSEGIPDEKEQVKAPGRPVRILIAMSDTGGGHRALSQAIAGAIARRYRDQAVVRIEDIFALPPQTLPERVTRLYGPVIRVAPWLYGRLYHSLNHRRRYEAFARLAARRMRQKISRLIETARPDIIVSTHPLANRPILDAIAADGRPIPVVAVVSELVSVHVSWVDPRLDLLNTATTETYQAVIRCGADPRRVRCVGLPVDERFGRVVLAPEELRMTMGLHPERFTALVIGGGEGAGGLARIVETIEAARLPLQLIVVCGRNERLRRRLEALPLQTPARIFGFVTLIPELMHAADVILTKGGPQTIAEALVSGRPVILTQTLPGQEEGNGTFVESRGVGFAPGPPRRVVENLARLVFDPSLRWWMTVNAQRVGRPEAAGQVARMIMDLARSQW